MFYIRRLYTPAIIVIAVYLHSEAEHTQPIIILKIAVKWPEYISARLIVILECFRSVRV